MNLTKSTNLLIIAVLISGALSLMLIYNLRKLKSSPDDGVEKIYFADNISPGHQTAIEAFNRIHHGSIEVVPVDLPFTKFSTNERKQLLIRSLRSKSSRIDIFSVDLIWIPRFAKWAEPLSPHFSAQELADILPYALQPSYVENELVSMPLYLDIGVLYYRRDLLRKLADSDSIERKLRQSMNWQEFVELGERFSGPDAPVYVYPADSYEGLVCSFMETVFSRRVSPFDLEPVALNIPELRTGLQLLVDLVGKYRLTPEIVTEFREIDSYLYCLRNDAVFFRGWPGNLRAFMRDYGDKIGEIGIAAMPHFTGQEHSAVFGGWSLMISKYSSSKAAATKFLKFLLDVEMQRTLFDAMGYLPVTRQVYADSVFVSGNPDLRFYLDYFDKGRHRPSRPDYTKMSDILSYYIRAAILNHFSVQDALRMATDEINSQKVLAQ